MKLLLQTKALADETRLRLLGVLARHELNVGEIVQVMKMGQSRISRHLKILMDAGFVACKRNGLWAFYATASGNGSEALLRAVLDGLKDMPGHVADLDHAAQVLSERRSSTVRFFDELAADWKRMSLEILGNFDLNNAILERLVERGTVVDLGCGPGILLKNLSGAVAQLIGVDNSSRMLEAAAKLLPNSCAISLRIGDLEHLPLRDGEADAAIMSLVLHHLAAPQTGIVEMQRIVRPGGQIMVVDFVNHDNETMRTKYGDRWLGFAPDELGAWMMKTGFQQIQRDEFPINMGLTLQMLTARREEFLV